ncbi:MAG: hypothetical protein OEW60_07845, partial [Thiovulaceae bacterium]|nr:hypothetical protein [Sulfurimonadaceae bacterium]
MKQLFSLFLATNVFLLSSVHAKQAELHYEPIPVPHLDKEKIHLKVAYVVNPHFDELPLTAIKEMLKETKRMAQEHFGLNISFEFPKRLLIKELFDQIPQKIKDHIQPMIIDISKETINPKAFKSFSKALKVALMENPTSLDEEFAFAKPYLSKKLESISDLDQLVFALTKTLFERVKKLQKFFGNDSYNEWLYWVSLGYTKMPYDLIITNQPIISVENVGVDIHPALR